MRQGSIATAESPGMVHDAALMHPTRITPYGLDAREAGRATSFVARVSPQARPGMTAGILVPGCRGTTPGLRHFGVVSGAGVNQPVPIFGPHFPTRSKDVNGQLTLYE